MTLAEVASMISDCKLPWRYDHFSETPNPPYIVYYYPSENDVFADCENYVNRRKLFVELFTETKDMATETAVEAVLRSNGMTWHKQTDFLSDEVIFQTTYEMEIIING